MRHFLGLVCGSLLATTSAYSAPIFPAGMNASEPSLQSSLNQIQPNKQIVISFYESAFNQKDENTALSFLSVNFIQHDPKLADGTIGLRNFILRLKAQYPDSHREIKHIFAEGDFVILHVFSSNDETPRGSVIVDIFRLSQGKIIEHWDAIQTIPERSANDHTMF